MTDNTDNLAKDLLASIGIKPDTSKQFEKLGLSFNPFPRAGVSDLNSTPYLISKLEPIDESVKKGIIEFVKDSLFSQNSTSSDKFISSVILGNYGYGKTQTLLYTKTLLEAFNVIKESGKKPYVIYIDNPGRKLSELIGGIIAEIGEENFKRYLWNIAFDKIASHKTFKDELIAFIPNGVTLFDDNIDPFDPVHLVSYKSFLDAWNKMLTPYPKRKKEFLDKLKSFIVSIFTDKYNSSTVAIYFYSLISENIGINKTWEALTTGGAKELEKKEVYILRAIVELIESQGYTDFYLLVDEFEDVTVGRLSAQEIDKYITNLRALIDKDRNWFSMYAMTHNALSRLKTVSPPLGERISTRLIDLKPLNDERAQTILINYLNLARPESTNIFPFDESGIKELRNQSQGILRVFLKSCFSFIQRALDELKPNETINSEFVKKHFQIEEE